MGDDVVMVAHPSRRAKIVQGGGSLSLRLKRGKVGGGGGRSLRVLLPTPFAAWPLQCTKLVLERHSFVPEVGVRAAILRPGMRKTAIFASVMTCTLIRVRNTLKSSV